MRRLSLLLLILAQAAMAQEAPPACTQLRDGATACLSGKLCRCGYQRGGMITARPDGWSWDCGVLRPSCGAPAAEPLPPAPMPQLYMEIPPGYPRR